MKNMTKILLGAVMTVGAVAMTAAPAHAARIGVYVGVGAPVVPVAPVAYVPPSPGPGYAWVGGYYNGPVWVPGYWNFVGVGYRVGRPFGHYGYYGRGPAFHGYVGPRGYAGHFRR